MTEEDEDRAAWWARVCARARELRDYVLWGWYRELMVHADRNEVEYILLALLTAILVFCLWTAGCTAESRDAWGGRRWREDEIRAIVQDELRRWDGERR